MLKKTRLFTNIAIMTFAVQIASGEKQFEECMAKYVKDFISLYQKDLPKSAATDCFEPLRSQITDAVAKLSQDNLETREVGLIYRLVPALENLEQCLVVKGLRTEETANELQKATDSLLADFKKCQKMR